jgi:positive phototaxis protein PixI
MSSAASRIQANLQELFKANLAPGNAYIRFQLTSEITALLSMEQVQESLVVEAEKITPLPNMAEAVIGIMSSRNRVFCVFDLAQLLALPSPLISPRQYQVIVLQTTTEQPIYIGLAINRLQGMIRLATDKIQPSQDGFFSNIALYTSGVVQEEKTMIPVLKFDRILEALSQIISEKPLKN